MKKYLMTGMAALAICAAFTSCSKDTDVYNSGVIQENEAVKAQQAYAEAFIATFGQPAANQDWGFGSRALTRTENANANEWADPTKEYGGLKVPPPLTDAQIAVVKKYFQTHDKLGYEDPQWSNYFIQQVYKGHTDVPQGCATPEEYTAANGSTKIIASDHMDHLVAVDPDYVDPETGEKGFYDHINNFNHGDCSTNDNVLTWSPDYVSSANTGPFHSDKIMYMKNSTTKSFGYYNSNASVLRTNYTGLVSYKTIMREMGAEADCLEDGWNRSFMGFDFEQMVDDECYAVENGTFKNMVIQGEYYINGVKQTNYVYQYNGQPVKILSAETNRYCGTLRTVSDSELYSDLRDANNNNNYLGKQLNTALIDGLLADGYLPVDTKQLREWIKVGGCADGYFSDWIVTLTEAKTGGTPDPTTIRIIAEDLNARAEEGNTGDSDWDFNDVVFDVEFTGDNTATITLRAAGGTLPLIVGVQNPVNGQSYPANEVHTLFQVDTDYMVNTKAEAKGLKGGDVALRPTINVEITGVKAQNGKNIPIHVEKVYNGTAQWVELTAVTGEPAAKIGVNPTFQWCNERDDIRSRYENFVTWVRTTNPTIWWNGVQ